MTQFLRSFHALFLVICACTSMVAIASPEEPESIRIKGRSYEISSVQSGEFIYHSPLDSLVVLLAPSSPRLFCQAEFVFCTHRQNGVLAGWEIKNGRLYLSSTESYVYRLTNGSFLSNSDFDSIRESRIKPDQFLIDYPGVFQKLNVFDHPHFHPTPKGEVTAIWFTGEIQIFLSAHKQITLRFKNGRLRSALPVWPNPSFKRTRLRRAA